MSATAEDDDQDDGEPVVRHADANHGDAGCDAVGRAPDVIRRQRSKHERQRECQHHRAKRDE